MPQSRCASALVIGYLCWAAACDLDHRGLAVRDPAAPPALDAAAVDGPPDRARPATQLPPDSAITAPDVLAGDAAPAPTPADARPDAAPPDAAREPEPSASLAAGLILYLPLDDRPGRTDAADRSGHHNDARLEGLDADRAWVPGRFGGALAFDGGWLRVDPAPSLDVSEAFTIAAWVQGPAEGEADGVILSRAAPGAGGYLYELLLEHGQPRVEINSSNGYRADLRHPRALAGGRWVHLAVTYALGSLRLFVDGEPVASDGYAHPVPPENSPVIVGARQRGPVDAPAPFAGQLDEVLLYERVLSPEEVAALARGQRPVER